MYEKPHDHPGIDPFLSAIVDNPHDDVPKMVFGDWLEERGFTNAARGMRFAGMYHKRPIEPRDGENMSGWLNHAPEATDYANPAHYAHARLPEAVMRGAPVGLNLSYYDKNPKMRVFQHWRDYLAATHNTDFDENNEPLSRYKEDFPLHNTDLAHPKP